MGQAHLPRLIIQSGIGTATAQCHNIVITLQQRYLTRRGYAACFVQIAGGNVPVPVSSAAGRIRLSPEDVWGGPLE